MGYFFSIFTARCYAQRGNQIALGFSIPVILHVVRLSVRLSVTIRYRDHIGWNSSK